MEEELNSVLRGLESDVDSTAAAALNDAVTSTTPAVLPVLSSFSAFSSSSTTSFVAGSTQTEGPAISTDCGVQTVDVGTVSTAVQAECTSATKHTETEQLVSELDLRSNNRRWAPTAYTSIKDIVTVVSQNRDQKPSALARRIAGGGAGRCLSGQEQEIVEAIVAALAMQERRIAQQLRDLVLSAAGAENPLRTIGVLGSNIVSQLSNRPRDPEDVD